MTDRVTTGTQKPVAVAFGILCGIAGLRHLMGLPAFFGRLAMMNSPETLVSLPEEQQELSKVLPDWLMIGLLEVSANDGTLK